MAAHLPSIESLGVSIYRSRQYGYTVWAAVPPVSVGNVFVRFVNGTELSEGFWIITKFESAESSVLLVEVTFIPGLFDLLRRAWVNQRFGAR